jgi:hypothetical protein
MNHNEPHNENPKPSALVAFLDRVALTLHDEEGDDDPRLSAGPKDECRIVVGRRIHPANNPTPRGERFPHRSESVASSSTERKVKEGIVHA